MHDADWCRPVAKWLEHARRASGRAARRLVSGAAIVGALSGPVHEYGVAFGRRSIPIGGVALLAATVMRASPTAPSTVTVVAFDGLVCETLRMRARALEEALGALTASAARREATPIDFLVDMVGGRTFAESARMALHGRGIARADADDGVVDETIIDLVALDAGRRYSAALSNGVMLASRAREWLAELGSRGRVVARADSSRRDVERVLALGALDGAFSFVRCSDDAPMLRGSSSIHGAWAALDVRLQSGGFPIERRRAFECAVAAVETATPFVGSVQHCKLG